jgi:hypothetical protein
MKKEFMFYIRNEGDAKASLTSDEHFAFIKKCETYIERLKAEGKLIAAQPIIRDGLVVSKNKNGWQTINIDPGKEVQVGYYHIVANDIDEAVAIAKENPEFEYVSSASIEIRPVKLKEEKTEFIYRQ